MTTRTAFFFLRERFSLVQIVRTPADAQHADSFEDYTPPSTMMLASRTEQKAAIDELQRCNNSLKQQLQVVSTELQAYKVAEKQLSLSLALANINIV